MGMKLIEKDALYLRTGLDLLFIALNPPVQSNMNGHYFSGKGSTFFKQLYESRLIRENIDRENADELVFGGTKYNYKNWNFGVIDLLPRIEETDSTKIRVKKEHVDLLFSRIVTYKPKYVCIIHSKVMKAIKEYAGIDLSYGLNGKVIENCDTIFFCNYFPNGNSIRTSKKLEIYDKIKSEIK